VSAFVVSAALVFGAYLMGSIPTGLLLARRRGVDLRRVGSGNIGATNAARSLGRRLGGVVLVLDALKGAVPALIASRLLEIDPLVVAATGFSAIVGHCFPVWLGFRGGKGVATSLGVMLALAPAVTGICAALFAALYLGFRIASIGSIAAALAVAPLLVAFGARRELVALAVTAALLILFKHRGNLRRLVRRQELRM
jgi:glycerol-3-phosphate acyltransferase PlsY